MKMIIEVSGGCVQNIIANDEISIYLIDHDNLERGQKPTDIATAYQPDAIMDADEILEIVNNHVEVYGATK